VAETCKIHNKSISQIKTKYILKHFIHMVLLFKNCITVILLYILQIPHCSLCHLHSCCSFFSDFSATVWQLSWGNWCITCIPTGNILEQTNQLMLWGWRSCRPLNIHSLQDYICHKMFNDFMDCVLLLCLVRTTKFWSQCCAVTQSAVPASSKQYECTIPKVFIAHHSTQSSCHCAVFGAVGADFFCLGRKSCLMT
jgi:hypothetical protein